MGKEKQAEKELTTIEKNELKFDELFSKLKETGIADHTYAPDAKVEISGKLFTSFINYVALSKNSLMQYHSAFEEVSRVMNNFIKFSDQMLDTNAEMTFHLMEEHLRQGGLGNTISQGEMDKVDAETKVQLTEEDK